MNVTSNQLIDFYHSSRQIYWEMDKDIHAGIRRLRDANGLYMWSPTPNYEDHPGTLIGIPVTISEEKCLQLRYIFPDGSSKIVKFSEFLEHK